MRQALLVAGGESASRAGWTHSNLFWEEPLGTDSRRLSIGHSADDSNAVAHDAARRGTGTSIPYFNRG
jgi:hypothetical protein